MENFNFQKEMDHMMQSIEMLIKILKKMQDDERLNPKEKEALAQTGAKAKDLKKNINNTMEASSEQNLFSETSLEASGERAKILEAYKSTFQNYKEGTGIGVSDEMLLLMANNQQLKELTNSIKELNESINAKNVDPVVNTKALDLEEKRKELFEQQILKMGINPAIMESMRPAPSLKEMIKESITSPIKKAFEAINHPVTEGLGGEKKTEELSFSKVIIQSEKENRQLDANQSKVQLSEKQDDVIGKLKSDIDKNNPFDEKRSQVYVKDAMVNTGEKKQELSTKQKQQIENLKNKLKEDSNIEKNNNKEGSYRSEEKPNSETLENIAGDERGNQIRTAPAIKDKLEKEPEIGNGELNVKTEHEEEHSTDPNPNNISYMVEDDVEWSNYEQAAEDDMGNDWDMER